MNAATPECRPATEEISGLIERVTFHNDESGFCVLRVKTPGHREETTVVGSLSSVTAGEWLVAEGWWVRDKEHGPRAPPRSGNRGPKARPIGILQSTLPIAQCCKLAHEVFNPLRTSWRAYSCP
jgi:hypothetical protein